MSPEDWKHLNDRVRRVDEDRWLSSRYADAPDRNALIALYAFSHELSKIKTTVSEPILGAMRFQWWRDVLEKMREEKQTPAHDVAQAVFATFASDKQLFDRLEHLIDKYQDAFEAKDPSKEPLEYELATACTLLDASWTGAEDIAKGWMEGDEASITIPEPVRPATAHIRLHHRSHNKKPPGPLARRFSVMMHVLTGKF